MSGTVTSLPTLWAQEILKEVDGVRKISNSETSAFLSCERKWYYQYVLNLTPVANSVALSRGVIGHECLAIYYQDLMDGKSYEDAEQAAYFELQKYFNDAFDITMLVGLMELLQAYFMFARDDGWKILAVERMYDVPVSSDYSYVMRLDLIARLSDGRTALIDHKFVYDFYQQDMIDMNVQLPKYMGALNYNGQGVDVAMLNQIRHRTKKGPMADDEKFRRSMLQPSGTEIKQIMREQFSASDRIVAFRNTDDDGESKVLRTQNNMTCKNCSMLSLCKADLMGSDTSLMKKIDYKINQGYGYNVEDKADV